MWDLFKWTCSVHNTNHVTVLCILLCKHCCNLVILVYKARETWYHGLHVASHRWVIMLPLIEKKIPYFQICFSFNCQCDETRQLFYYSLLHLSRIREYRKGSSLLVSLSVSLSLHLCVLPHAFLHEGWMTIHHTCIWYHDQVHGQVMHVK